MAGSIGAVLPAADEQGLGHVPATVVPVPVGSDRVAGREAELGPGAGGGGWRAQCLAALATYAEVCAWI